MHRNLNTVCTKRQRIAELAKQSPEMAFTSLAYLIDHEWLLTAYGQVRKDGAVGVDGLTAAEYEKDLEGNLLNRAKSGTYKAQPVRRVYIPKGPGSGEMRPLGIPCLEDKILQRAVVMLLEPIYEHDFLDCSYGFRPGRSTHMALTDLNKQLFGNRGGFVLDVDLRKFFDTLDFAHVRSLLQRRVRDGVVLRLINKWLKAGVMEEGKLFFPETGSPQGGVISPLLANIYLHYVLDRWFADEVVPRMKGRAFLVRFADDFVMGFTHESDARRVLAVLPKRMEKYGLTVHPEKTRLVPYRRPPKGQRGGKGPGTFQFLGFTHYWGRSRRGNWVLKIKTAADRLSRAIRKIAAWCRANRHLEVREQHRILCQKIRGHFAYYGWAYNYRSLATMVHQVTRLWQKWLNRRNRERAMPWPRFRRLLERYPLPCPRIVHRFPYA